MSVIIADIQSGRVQHAPGRYFPVLPASDVLRRERLSRGFESDISY